MSVQLVYWEVAPQAVETLMHQEKYLANAVVENNLDKKLVELIKTRVSQMNGCAYCIDMHTKDARALGESEQRLYGLNAWREAPYYTAQERAALAWCEAITQLSPAAIQRNLLATLRDHFDDKSIVDLTLAICTINSWNRFAIGFGANVGSYQVGQYN